MAELDRDPEQVESDMEATEQYQAPPREHDQEVGSEQPPSGAGDPVRVSLLEAQQPGNKPGMSETKDGPATSPVGTVSGKDELADPAHPRATPPGERM
jgi:hypothetical protein